MKQKLLSHAFIFLLITSSFLTYLFFQCPFESNGKYLELWDFIQLPVCGPKSNSFATLLGGLGAIMAAIIAFSAVEKQINEQAAQIKIDRKRKADEYKIEVNKERLKERDYRCAIMKAIIADISALTNRLKDIGLNDQNGIASSIRDVYRLGGKYEIMRVEENYFVVFDSLLKDIASLPPDLVKEIFDWYISGKGYIETIKIAKNNIYSHTVHIEQQAAYIVSETEKLIDKGHAVIEKISFNLRFEDRAARSTFLNIMNFEEKLLDG